MALKDLTEYLTPALELPWKDHLFTVQPPSREDGLVMAAINTMGTSLYAASLGACSACGRSGELEVDPTVKALANSASDRSLGELSLGAVLQEMIDVGVPNPDIEVFELYAFYYWVVGEDAADQILAARAQARGGIEVPKARPASKSGRNTASASQSATTKTATRSTRTTASQKK